MNLYTLLQDSPDPLPSEFCREVRREYALTRDQMSEMLGVSAGWISQLESGAANCSKTARTAYLLLALRTQKSDAASDPLHDLISNTAETVSGAPNWTEGILDEHGRRVPFFRRLMGRLINEVGDVLGNELLDEWKIMQRLPDRMVAVLQGAVLEAANDAGWVSTYKILKEQDPRHIGRQRQIQQVFSDADKTMRPKFYRADRRLLTSAWTEPSPPADLDNGHLRAIMDGDKSFKTDREIVRGRQMQQFFDILEDFFRTGKLDSLALEIQTRNHLFSLGFDQEVALDFAKFTAELITRRALKKRRGEVSSEGS